MDRYNTRYELRTRMSTAGLDIFCTAGEIMLVDWLYERPICTGLGDRLGTIIALSALASLHNSSYVVHIEWCTDPMLVTRQNPLHLQYIPKWTGYDYPIENLHRTITLPANIRLFTAGQGTVQAGIGMIREGGVLPSWQGIMHTSTLYCQAITLGTSVGDWTTRQCETAYRKAGNQVHPIPQQTEDKPFVLVHFRSPDDNTCRIGRDETPFCTPTVLRELHAAGVYMKVISNNHSFSMQWLRGLPSIQLVHSRSAFQDMALALSAVAIVQHASEGWSSYTSVPAMAHGIPLINTFTGRDHRFDMFTSHGDLPREFYSCQRTDAFVREAVRALV